MSELIRRVNSQPNSPFSNGPSYSPLAKSLRTMLSRIAPIHPNRRTSPPPLPRPPTPKKSKKQIEMKERIEEELSETVEGWSCMTDERRDLRRARIDAKLGYEYRWSIIEPSLLQYSNLPVHHHDLEHSYTFQIRKSNEKPQLRYLIYYAHNLCSIKQRMLDSCTIAGAGACISVHSPSLSPLGTKSDN
ncbi:hypothetical protein EV424DRAFT_725173 [Suillus variegatus]|nr:hypothetical protein EV424DRAFT_725173 [Suillus variegatus]